MLGVDRLMSDGDDEDLASFETTVKSDSGIANSIGFDINSSALMAGIQMKTVTLFGKDFIGVFAKRTSDEVSEVSFDLAGYAYTHRGALLPGHELNSQNTYYLTNPDIAGRDHNFDGDIDATADTGNDINDDGDYTDRKYLG